jgi:hypothetical protein
MHALHAWPELLGGFAAYYTHHMRQRVFAVVLHLIGQGD